MRLTIGHRLFLSVLLAMLAVAAAAVLLLRQQVMSSFSDYAVKIELDRLESLSSDIGKRYTKRGSWQFVPSSPFEQQRWIAQEMGRLQAERGLSIPPAPPAPAPPPPPPAPPGTDIIPPLPPPSIDHFRTVDAQNINQLPLQDRVTLLDRTGGYLAGRRLQADDATVRRPVLAGGVTAGFLAVTKAELPSDALASTFLQQLKDSLWIIIVASILMSAVAAMLLATHFRKPIQHLADGARQLADGRYDTRLAITRSDELGTLAASFNQLAEKLDNVEASRRQWVADTSHELRTPLAVLRAQLEAMQDGVRAPSADNVASMLRQVGALNKLIDQLYLLAKADVGELDCRRVPLDVCALAREQIAAFSDRFARAGMSVASDGEVEPCMINADPDRLRQVLTNILENAIRYCGAGARVVVSVHCHGGVAELVTDDSGPGVPDAALAHLADRFYRVDASRSRDHGGAGLGLALSQRIVAAHGGQLTFARSPLGGLQVRVAMAAA